MSKYGDLVGIDLSSKEVYETSDVEDSFQLSEILEERRDSISDDQMNVDENRLKFEKKMVGNANTDFSDRIDKISNHTFETYTVKETTHQKLSRITQDLLDLNEEVIEENDEELHKKVEHLEKLFNEINTKTKDKKLIPRLTLEDREYDKNSVATIKIEDPFVISGLEKRIHKIEKIIGSDITTTDISVQSFINDIYRKMKLISNDSDSMARISVLIDDINSKFEKSIAVRRALYTDQTEFVKEDEKINEIYTRFIKLDNFENELPLIIKRLESLNVIHLGLSDCVETTENMTETIDIMQRDIESWNQSLTVLEKQIEDLNTNFEATKQKIFKKLDIH